MFGTGFVVVLLAFGLAAGLIAEHRGGSFGWFFLAGCGLGVFGVLAALLYQPSVEPAEDVGYWPDPVGRFDERYFDGHQWTDAVFNHNDPRPHQDPV
jgi:hypothetical protein